MKESKKTTEKYAAIADEIIVNLFGENQFNTKGMRDSLKRLSSLRTRYSRDRVRQILFNHLSWELNVMEKDRP
jgi:hypothetical protein